jgi:hypothetical protein
MKLRCHRVSARCAPAYDRSHHSSSRLMETYHGCILAVSTVTAPDCCHDRSRNRRNRRSHQDYGDLRLGRSRDNFVSYQRSAGRAVWEDLNHNLLESQSIGQAAGAPTCILDHQRRAIHGQVARKTPHFSAMLPGALADHDRFGRKCRHTAHNLQR